MPVEKDYYNKTHLKEIVTLKDPFIQYLIVRKSLNMPSGKVAAQCNHAGKYIMAWSERRRQLKESDDVQKVVWDIINWMYQGGRVAVLQANDKQWEKIKKELRCIVVKDAGVNCQETEGQETVLAVFPMKKSEQPKLLKRLQLYR